MEKTTPLRLNREFLRAYRRGKSCVTKYFVVYACRNRTREMRLGITVSKKIGNAVKRNRVKRVLKESYRLLEGKIAGGYDIVLVARTRCLSARQPDVQRLLEKQLGKLHLLATDGQEASKGE